MKFIFASIVLAAASMATTVFASPMDPANDASGHVGSSPAPYHGYAIGAAYAINDGIMHGLNITESSSYGTGNSTNVDVSSIDLFKPIPHDGFIPISHFKCTGDKLDAKEMDTLTERVIRWGLRRTNKVRSKSFWSTTWGGVTWYFCNCKWNHDDHLPKAEIDEVIKFLEERCGPRYSGWVYSHHWLKGYTLASTNTVLGKKSYLLCPPLCFY